jgi:hypothetical protein
MIDNSDGGILAALWRGLINEMNLSSSAIRKLVKLYTASKLPIEIKKKLSKFDRDSEARSMTWKNFVNLLREIGIRKFTISIEITDRDGKKHRHSVSAKLSDDE